MSHSQLKSGVVLSYLSRSVTIIVGLLYTPVMIRLLGQNEFGLYNIAASIIAYLGVLNLGFSSAYIRFYSRYNKNGIKDKISVLNGMFLITFSFLGVLAVIAGVLVAGNLDNIFGTSLTNQELRVTMILITILVINLGFSFPNIVFSTYIQANEQFVFLNMVEIIRQITAPLITLPLLLMGYGSIGMVIGTTVVNVTLQFVNIYYSYKKLNIKFSFTNFDKNLMKEISIYSFYIFINMVVDQVNQNVDKTILGRYSGSVATAIYSVGERIEMIYHQLSTSISNVFIPRIHKMVSDKINNRELNNLFTKIGRIQFMLLSAILIGFIFFGRPFIGIWAGKEYYDTYPIALLLMISVTIPLIQTVGIEIQRAKNMHQLRSWIYLLMAFLNLIISIPLVQKYEGFGAAIGTSLSYIIGNGLAMNIYNHYKVGLNMHYFWKEIIKFIPSFIVPILYGIIINLTVDLYNIFNLIMYGLIYILLYVVSLWLFGMNEYEKKMLKNLLK